MATSTTLTTHMDDLAKHIADLQSKTAALFYHPLPSINSDVYGAARGDCNDVRSVVEDVRKLLSDLLELCASAEAAVEAHRELLQELDRLASEEDALELTADGTAAEHAGAGVETARPCA